MCIKKQLAFLLGIVILGSCSSDYHKFVSRYSFTANNGVPDYDQLDYWAAHPEKWDPSDSIPKPLRISYQQDTAVDVFFIHPTTYTDENKIFGCNAPTGNAELNAKTDYTTILSQASIFNEAGRVFAPRYRQAHISCYFPKTKEDSIEAKAAFELAYLDVKTAFIYYLTHKNNNRPIIVAAHSQGSTHAIRLLAEFFDQQPLQNNLIAAYIVGMALNPDIYQSIKPCKTPNDNGCIISWRTYKKGYIPDFVLKEKFTSLVYKSKIIRHSSSIH